MHTRKIIALRFAAWAMFAAALLHVAALFAGPETLIAIGAPVDIVVSAQQGTWLAPLTIIGIGTALGVLGLYALSALGTFRRLPGVRLVLGAAAGVFLLRALALPAVWVMVPALREKLTLFEVATALLCLLIGLAFLAGLRAPAPVAGRAAVMR